MINWIRQSFCKHDMEIITPERGVWRTEATHGRESTPKRIF